MTEARNGRSEQRVPHLPLSQDAWKLCVLIGRIPDALVVWIRNLEVQIRTCWSAGQRTARQRRRGWEKVPEYRKQGKCVLQARAQVEQTSVGSQEAWVLVLAVAPWSSVTSGQSWNPWGLIVPGGQQKTLSPYAFGCSRRRRGCGGICRAGGTEIFRAMLPNSFHVLVLT